MKNKTRKYAIEALKLAKEKDPSYPCLLNDKRRQMTIRETVAEIEERERQLAQKDKNLNLITFTIPNNHHDILDLEVDLRNKIQKGIIKNFKKNYHIQELDVRIFDQNRNYISIRIKINRSTKPIYVDHFLVEESENVYTFNMIELLDGIRSILDIAYNKLNPQEKLYERHLSTQTTHDLLDKIDHEHSHLCRVCGGKLETVVVNGSIRDENGEKCFPFSKLIKCGDGEDYRIFRYCTNCGLLFARKI